MLRFSKMNTKKLMSLEHILVKKKNNYISDLDEEEFEDIKFYKCLF
jgi:hypothetical protein